MQKPVLALRIRSGRELNKDRLREVIKECNRATHRRNYFYIVCDEIACRLPQPPEDVFHEALAGAHRALAGVAEAHIGVCLVSRIVPTATRHRALFAAAAYVARCGNCVKELALAVHEDHQSDVLRIAREVMGGFSEEIPALVAIKRNNKPLNELVVRALRNDIGLNIT